MRERVSSDSTAPKRRRLKASGTATGLPTPAASRRRPRATTRTRLVRGRRARPIGGVASPPPRRDGIAPRRAKTPRTTRSGRDREKRKLARVRDGRYASARARFVV